MEAISRRCSRSALASSASSLASFDSSSCLALRSFSVRVRSTSSRRYVFPFAAFGAEVMDAIALDAVFADAMITAFFQVEFKGVGQQKHGRQKKQQDDSHMFMLSPKH